MGISNFNNVSNTDKKQKLSEKNENVPASKESAIGASGGSHSNTITIPSISLPKGGGALKSIDEKFQVNAANGTASFSIPLPFSKTRSDFTPTLSLSYNSGSGNSAFGLGWNLDLFSIQRKTDKLLPRYRDELEEDTFQFSGVEDLVPSLKVDQHNNWINNEYSGLNGEKIKRYRPRIEGSFNRIEKITLNGSNIFYWKVTSKSNVVTVFGKSSKCRIVDPNDDSRIFKWLPELSYDDKGNCFEFEYVPEDFKNVNAALHERNRLNGIIPCANNYLKRIRYGNTNPYYPKSQDAYNPSPPLNTGYLFEAVFDYGDQDETDPSAPNPIGWPSRLEPFSEYKAGFEIRTYRLCRRMLFFHYFKELNDLVIPGPCLVRSLDLTYKLFQNKSASFQQVRNAEADYILSFTHVGYVRKSTGGYLQKQIPPIEFSYKELKWNTSIENVLSEDFENAPVGLGNNYYWTDLWSEGISGILTEQANGWFFKNNLGEGRFSPANPVIPKPSVSGLKTGSWQIQDLEADGRKFVVSLQTQIKGYFELNDKNEWLPFQNFEAIPNINFNDANTKFIDLTGDGKPDLVISEENVFVWYTNLGIAGYDSFESAHNSYDEEKGPAMVFADALESIFLADMSGDGMTDIVRIRNGEISYWPNLGFGKFGAKVNMSNAPIFDAVDLFNPSFLHLADISGTGATDVLYLGKNKFTAWLNLSGNNWSEEQSIDAFPATGQFGKIDVIDFLGKGTGCIVWSSPLPQYADSLLRYIDLMGGIKPYIMTGYKNNFGKEVSWTYKSSTSFYLEDKRVGNPWITKLPFPVQCVAQVITNDLAAGTVFTNSYSFHHGYYDHIEREFRGFGRVELVDSEDFQNFKLKGTNNVVDDELHQPPVKTISWFHTGAYFNQQNILAQFSNEYNKGPHEFDLPEPVLPDSLAADECREALRACKGMLLRQEIYELDGSKDESKPFSVNTHNCFLQTLQPRAKNKYSVFLQHESEALNVHYERELDDPRISHTLNLEVDVTGNVLKSASVAYGRKTIDATLPPAIQDEQTAVHVVITQKDLTINPLNPTDDFYFDTPTVYQNKLPSEVRTYELTKSTYNNVTQFLLAGLLNDFVTATAINYEDVADGSLQKRLISDIRTVYVNNDLITPMALGQMDSLALAYETYRLALTPSLIISLYGNRVSLAMLFEANYVQHDGTNWWTRSGRNNYLSPGETSAKAAERFYMPVSIRDPFDIETQLFYDEYNLILIKITDVLQNTTSVEMIDYRTLQPTKLKDLNNNFTEILTDELGMVIVTSVYGDEGDGVHGDQPLSGYMAVLPVNIDEVISSPQKFIQQATSFFYYDLFAWMNKKQPVCFASAMRQTHVSELSGGNISKIFLSVGYSSGLAQNMQTKLLAEPGDALQWGNGILQTVNNVSPRWTGTGRTILNNKGNPVKQYEPFFSTTFRYESEKELVEIGFSSTIKYDALGRKIQVNHPNGTFSTTEFSAWVQRTFDENDNVKNCDWYRTINNPDSSQPYYQDWYDEIKTDPEKVAALIDAANKASAHDRTPTQIHLDSLGRNIYSIADNGDAGTYSTRLIFDIENNQREVIDARDNVVMKYEYDMTSRQCNQAGVDAGNRWVFSDITDQPVYKWDNRDQRFRIEYDQLHRPLNHWLTQMLSQLSKAEMDALVTTGKPQNRLEKLISFIVYGEKQVNDIALNLRGKVFRAYDQSGLVQTSEYDFKGNVKNSFKKLASEYKNIVDWNSVTDTDVLLDSSSKNIFNSSSKFDATSKPVEIDMPDGSKIFPLYNEANLLEEIKMFIADQNQTVDFIKNIDYNAKGQRESIVYGNNTSTRYSYDARTYRLTRLLTTRNKGVDIMQDLNYIYDPIGNITQIIDNAQQTIYFNNNGVDTSQLFQYDAIYRLTNAEGREHAGQNKPCDQFDNDKRQGVTGKRLVLPGDMNAMQRYRQRYEYDEVGNMLRMIHNAGNGAFTNQWTRTFEYNNDDTARMNNQIISGTQKNNRLLNEYTGARGSAANAKYKYDEHGNMLNLQQGSFTLTWNFINQLQKVDLGGGGIAYYVYDARGQRVRKVIENGGLIKERIYLDHYEIHRETQGGVLQLERQTLHIVDDKSRIALVETRKQGSDNGLPFLIRYQYANHLGTASIELSGTLNSSDEQFTAGIISYEEYYPYGSTAYQAMDNETETSKRYRYTGMERDEESGLNYHSARYYAPWLARWASPDLPEFSDDFNLYNYTQNNPVRYLDTKGKSSIEFPDNPDGLMVPDFVIEERAQEIQRSQDYQHFKTINQVLNSAGGLDLSAGLSALQESYLVDDLNTLTYQLQNLDPGIRTNPRPNVQGIGPITEYNDSNQNLTHLSFTGKASIDDDGTGPSHNDPSHDTLPGNRNINADSVPYAVISQSLLAQLGNIKSERLRDRSNPAVKAGLNELPYGSIALVKRGGLVFPAVIEDGGPYHSAGEVSVFLAQQIGNFSRFGGQGPVDRSASDVSYYFFRGGSNNPITGNYTVNNISERARAVLTERLQQRADELFQRILNSP